MLQMCNPLARDLPTVTACAAGGVAHGQKADTWSNRPIWLLLPFSPGGGTEFVRRSVGRVA